MMHVSTCIWDIKVRSTKTLLFIAWIYTFCPGATICHCISIQSLTLAFKQRVKDIWWWYFSRSDLVYFRRVGKFQSHALKGGLYCKRGHLQAVWCQRISHNPLLQVWPHLACVTHVRAYPILMSWDVLDWKSQEWEEAWYVLWWQKWNGAKGVHCKVGFDNYYNTYWHMAKLVMIMITFPCQLW